MRRIAGAIEEGAKTWLNRQLMSVSIIAVIIFLLLCFTRDFFTAFGFLIGATCSMAAGYIGMRVAVISNCRVLIGEQLFGRIGPLRGRKKTLTCNPG
jgi:K(+)-stimulated pyrophosphate-energized sodium pump